MTSGSALEVQVRSVRSGRVCVSVAGEIDLSSADLLKRSLARELTHGRRLLLDLSAVTFIDSSGLAAIIGAYRDSLDAGAEIELSSDLPDQARRLFELTVTLPLLGLSTDGHAQNGDGLYR